MPRPKLDDSEKLATLSVRFTQRQMARMQRIAGADGLPVQDHIRRALDDYCEGMEGKMGLPFLPLGAMSIPPPAPAHSPAPQVQASFTEAMNTLNMTPTPARPSAPSPSSGFDLPEIDEE